MKTKLLALLCLCSTTAFADDIAFGTLKGIKVYDFTTPKVTKIFFSDNATSKTLSQCNGVATITHSTRSPESLKQITSLAISAYISGKKVRAFSSNNSCELDFLAMQESHF